MEACHCCLSPALHQAPSSNPKAPQGQTRKGQVACVQSPTLLYALGHVPAALWASTSLSVLEGNTPVSCSQCMAYGCNISITRRFLRNADS